MIVQLLAGFALFYLAWSLLALEVNYRRASAMRIPLIRLPVDPLNVLWQVFEPHVWPILDRLPIPLPEFCRYARRGWYFGDKAVAHLKYGPIWALVTPRDIHVHVCDSEAIHSIFSRRHDFLSHLTTTALLEVYGPCISTADANNWPRHRKILAAPFNESAMSYVWSESLRQTSQMVEAWTLASTSGIPSVAKDTQGGIFSYRDALQIVLDNSILLMLISPRHLNYSWLPQSLRKIGVAASDFKKQMVRMLEEETMAMVQGEKGSESLMTSFVRALHMHDKDDGSKGPKGLTVNEIFGNTFVINFAGHDTTANTLAFSILLLAAYPEVQNWVAEEVEQLNTGNPDQEWDYHENFPLLKRCQAVLHETLRLYPPIMDLPKSTNQQPQRLRVGNREIIIPPLTGVQPNVMATHTNSKYWTEPLSWNPRRWINPDNGDFYIPAQGQYFPWSDGP